MYIDGVILFSLVVLFLIIVMMFYVFRYFYRHMQDDFQAHEQTQTQDKPSLQ